VPTLRVALALIALLAAACGRPPQPVRPTGATGECVPPARWVLPATHAERPTPAIIARAARSHVVLLGEYHDHPDDHRWQLQTVAALAAQHPSVVLGFEMFPRRTQPVLDRWVAGELDERALLRETDWPRVWGFPAELYLPLLQFARLNRVPVQALNVDRSLVARVGREGWAAVPVGEREGVSDPAPASPAYEAFLSQAMAAHGTGQASDEAGRRHFVEAQLTWDRAIAESLMAAARAHPGSLVIGIMGVGHLEHGYGVPHQLAALGAGRVTVLLPWEPGRDCATLAPDLADAVFGIPPSPEEPDGRPRLGITLAPAEHGVRVSEVTAGSIAAAAGLRRGDVIIEAAGAPVMSPGDLRAVVDAQAEGTWLPLTVQRGGRTLKLVARFGRRP